MRESTEKLIKRGGEVFRPDLDEIATHQVQAQVDSFGTLEEQREKIQLLQELNIYGRKLVEGRGDQTVWLVEFPQTNDDSDLKFKDTVLAKKLGFTRQETFKSVGEEIENGGKPDLDEFDETAAQLVVLDKEGNIVGGYRIWRTDEELKTKELDEAVYNSHFFNYSDEFKTNVLDRSMETGRSFVLRDSKWVALFAMKNTFKAWHKLCTEEIENRNEDLRYLFGGVSISNDLPCDLQEKLIYFLQNIVSERIPKTDVSAKNPENEFLISEENNEQLKKYFEKPSSEEGSEKIEFEKLSPEEALKKIKDEFTARDEEFPTLFDTYIGIEKPGAIKFGTAVYNPDRGNCIEVMMLVDLKNLADDLEKRFGDPDGVALRDKIKK